MSRRDKDRERQRETERDRERQSETERDRERQSETERDSERQSERSHSLQTASLANSRAPVATGVTQCTAHQHVHTRTHTCTHAEVNKQPGQTHI